MMKRIMKKLMLGVFAALVFCVFPITANATQTEETSKPEREATELTFEIALYTYEIIPEATQEDMPAGFKLDDWVFNGVEIKAGFTENSDMVCVMAEDWDTGYQYRFIYDPNHEMFVPYFGAEIKNGYIYTIPLYDGAEAPYGFEEAYFLIQTVPMFTYKRMDAELTQEEIALGVLSDDNYLVFLMMDENGKEVHYTYDLIDRTYQRALLQKKDAEMVTELNEVIDELHAEIGALNANHAERMNGRLTIIGVLIAAVIVMAGIIVNLMLKVSKLKQGVLPEEEIEEDEDEEDVETSKHGGLIGFFKKKVEESEEDLDEESDDEEDSKEEEMPKKIMNEQTEDSDELEILDLDLDDL